MSHTPGPWEAKPTAGHDTHGQSAIYGPDGRDIAIVYDGKANARLIVQAVNSHTALVAALEGVLDWWDHGDEEIGPHPIQAARAALALAKETK